MFQTKHRGTCMFRSVGRPDYEVSYVLDQGFSREYLLAQLKDGHAKKTDNIPYISPLIQHSQR
jgi:hypothetical protein